MNMEYETEVSANALITCACGKDLEWEVNVVLGGKRGKMDWTDEVDIIMNDNGWAWNYENEYASAECPRCQA